jgi:hypothetical protein
MKGVAEHALLTCLSLACRVKANLSAHSRISYSTTISLGQFGISPYLPLMHNAIYHISVPYYRHITYKFCTTSLTITLPLSTTKFIHLRKWFNALAYVHRGQIYQTDHSSRHQKQNNHQRYEHRSSAHSTCHCWTYLYVKHWCWVHLDTILFLQQLCQL